MELKTKNMEIEGKKFKIQELTTDALCDIGALGRKDEAKATKQLIVTSIIEPKLTLEDLKKQPARIGNRLVAEIMKLNGITVEGFMKVPVSSPKRMSGN